MLERNLTKEADKIICSLYKEYLERRKNGLSKSAASYFEDSPDIQKSMFPQLIEEDVTDICWELHQAGYLSCCPGDNLANEVTLTNAAIVYMENRFKNGFVEVAKFLSNFIP